MGGQRFQTDNEDAPLFRQKTCPSGWHYRCCAWQFEIGSGSIVGEFASIAHTETKTTVTIEFTKDIEIISGEVQISQLATSLIANMIVAPHISEENGGSKKMVSNYDLFFKPVVYFDGRSSKHVAYDAAYHSGKIEISFEHGGSVSAPCQLVIEVYEG